MNGQFDLTNLLEKAPIHDAARASGIMDDITARARSFKAAYESRLGGMNAAGWAEVLPQYEQLLSEANLLQRAAQVSLFENRTKDTERLYDTLRNFHDGIRKELDFVKQEVTRLPEADFAALTKAGKLERYQPWMRYTREVERVDPDPALKNALHTTIEDYKRFSANIEEVGTSEQQADAVAAFYDKAIGQWQDMARAKGYDSIRDMQLARDQISPEMLAQITDAANKGLGNTHGYMDWKRKELGHDKPSFGDIEAEVPYGYAGAMSWEKASREIPEVFRRLDPEMGQIADEVVAKRVDARHYPDGKEEMDQCILVEGHEGYVITHFDPESPYAFSTATHEIAHGIHATRSADQPNVLYGMDYSMPPPLLEVHSLFAQRVLLSDQLAQASAKERRGITYNHVEDQMWYNTTCLAYHFFEEALHDAKSQGHTLTTELISDKWEQSFKRVFGDQMEMDAEARLGWKDYMVGNYIVETPHYAYSYVLASRVAEMLHQQYEQNPEQFREKYAAMQKAGQSMPLADMLQQYMDIDISDPAVWQNAEQSRGQLLKIAQGEAQAADIQKGTTAKQHPGNERGAFNIVASAALGVVGAGLAALGIAAAVKGHSPTKVLGSWTAAVMRGRGDSGPGVQHR